MRDYDGADPIETELGPGEQVLWKGRPDASRLLGARDVLFVPFSFMWAGFAVFWEVNAVTSGAPLFFVLWGIPFLGVAAFITVGRLFVKRARKRRTWYAVTNRRVLIVEAGRTRSVGEVPVGQTGRIEYRPRSRGGDLVFGSSNIIAAVYANSGMDVFLGRYGGAPMAFYDVIDVDQAKQALDRARAGS